MLHQFVIFLPGPREPPSAASETVEQGLDRHGQGTARTDESSRGYSHADNSHSFSFVEAKLSLSTNFGNQPQDIAKKGSTLRETPRRLNSPLVRSGKLTGGANILPATAVHVSNGRCCKDGELRLEAHRTGAEDTQEARRDILLILCRLCILGLENLTLIHFSDMYGRCFSMKENRI
jgi:hypothetical protein